jgi:O-antigen/teichoic acid export membrane protein
LVLARILGAEIYGHLRVINAVLALATVFATFGLGAGVAKFVSQYPSRAGATFATSLRTGLLTSWAVATGLFLLSSTTRVITDGVARSYLRVLAWTLPFFVVGALGLAFLYGLKRLQRKAMLKAALDVCRVGLQVGGGWFMALPGVVYGKLAGSIIAAITGLAAARHKWHWQDRSDLRGQLLRFSGFSFLSASFSTLLVTTDTLTISTLLGAATVVGYYGVAALLALALTMPAAALAHSAFPYISERQNRPGRAAEYIRGLVRRAIIISAPLCIAGWALGGIGVRVLYGMEYAPSVGLFRILVIGAFLRSVVGPVGTAIHALGRPDVNLGLLLITGTLNVGLNILLVGAIGAAGAAWATNIVSALNLALGWWALRRMVLQRL